MAAIAMTDVYLRMSGDLWRDLRSHLFPGDGDEHGAVIGAGIVETDRGTRLLARTLYLAEDGIDYVPGQHGYRMLTPSFVRDRILDCRRAGLAYLAVHCHGGHDAVRFSADDMDSHDRGYPALRDINEGKAVGALVFASNAVAGDIWLPGGDRIELTSATVAGRPIRHLYPAKPASAIADQAYDRQARIFGDRGQALLRQQKVGVIGAGGAGSLIVEYLARLGVGELVVIDNDRLEASNLPRVVGSLRRDAMPWLTDDARPAWLRKIARRFARQKVLVARRVARRSNPSIAVDPVFGSVVEDAIAKKLIDCDYLFLAADSMQARLVFNALVHQYLIPGTQVGAKVTVDRLTGDVLDIFSVTRPITPDLGCLWCNGLISPARLQGEALSPEEREQQRYVEDETVTAPSVITLNAVAVSHAVDDFLFSVAGLLEESTPHRYLRFSPRDWGVRFEEPRKDEACRECGRGPKSRFGLGQTRSLPTR